MGGDHSILKGEINFSTGKTKITTFANDVIEGSFELSAGTHELTIYYIERGGGASNLMISFDLTPTWNYESKEVATVTANKVWIDENGEKIDYNDTKDLSEVVMGLFRQYTSENYSYSGGMYTVDVDGKSKSFTLTDGECYDASDGLLYAYFDDDDGSLYVRVDKQTVNYDNKWSYTWEMLDASYEYKVKELTVLEEYIQTMDSNEFSGYNYWSITGWAELQTMIEALKNDNTIQILLTDGAQKGAEDTTSLSYPILYDGYAICADTDTTGVLVQYIPFSVKATLVDSDKDDSLYYYGVTSDSYIQANRSTAVWTLVPCRDSNGELICEKFMVDNRVYSVPTFYLMDSTGTYYLAAITTDNALSSYVLKLVTNVDQATAFFYDLLGELNTVDEIGYVGYGLRVTIDSGEGKYALVKGRESSTDISNVKIYVLQETETQGITFTATNALKTFSLFGAGGTGTNIYYIFGGSIALTVVVVLLKRPNRRKRREKAA